MADSPREILRRIRGIKSTQQITRAMEMVAAVKLTKVRTQAENSRAYVNRMGLMMRALISSAGEIEHPLFASRDEKRVLLVVITSDRGLCGTFNVNVMNAVKDFTEANPGVEISMVAVGRKGQEALARMGRIELERLERARAELAIDPDKPHPEQA